MTSQQAIVQFLTNPTSYRHDVASVEVRETHGSWVFLAGPYVYKLKKDIDLGFFDYSTPEKRRYYCEQEVCLNRRLARGIYLGVLAVREIDGQLCLSSLAEREGRGLDFVVQMKRLPEALLLSERLKSQAPTEDEIRGLVDVLAAFYKNSERGPEIDRYGSPEVIRHNVVENFDQTERFVGSLFPKARFHAICSAQLSFLSLQEKRFGRRVEEGWIRDGHGDLRAEHVAFVPEPVVIDCIEFASRLRYGDVASDLAFLKMDLDFLGAPKLAERLVQLYGDVSGDRDLHRVLDFYISYRAYVRAKVDAIKLHQTGRDSRERTVLEHRAKRYFELAYYHTLKFHKPQCILIGGLSGTGKSTLAHKLSACLGAPVLRSDEIRKALAGTSADHGGSYRFGSGMYSEEFTRQTYLAMRSRASELLGEGSTVILDATFSLPKQRDLFVELSHDAGVKLIQFECRTRAEVAAQRMSRREQEGLDVSDATPAIQDAQQAAYTPPLGAVVLDTTKPPGVGQEEALEHLRRAI